MGLLKEFSCLALVGTCILGCDVTYDFGDVDHTVGTEMKVTLTWWTVTPMDHPAVYMSTATGTACNSGYFGAQFHANGTSSLLFSMWDAPKFDQNPEFTYQSLPGSKNCHRNALDSSGKSTGTQCAPDIGGEKVNLELGVPYVFTFAIVAQNTSGAMWEVSMFDTANQDTISIGKIFFVDEPMGLTQVCRTLGKSQNPSTSGLASYTFMEYFAEPRDFLTVATWSDMVIKSSKSTTKWERIGKYGGCATDAQPDPPTLSHHPRTASIDACQTLCANDTKCSAYAFCKGSNCDGNCDLYPATGHYTKSNGYPGVQCFQKTITNEVRPTGIQGECCDHPKHPGDHVNGTSTTCLPPECESPSILFTMGPKVLIPDKTLRENPTCLGDVDYSARGAWKSFTECWRNGSPNSLDDCFARPNFDTSTIVV